MLRTRCAILLIATRAPSVLDFKNVRSLYSAHTATLKIVKTKFPVIINVLFPLLRLAHSILYNRNYIKSVTHEYVLWLQHDHKLHDGIFASSRFLCVRPTQKKKNQKKKKCEKCKIHCSKETAAALTKKIAFEKKLGSAA